MLRKELANIGLTTEQLETVERLFEEEKKMKYSTIGKVRITYKVIRGANDNEVAETCIDLPISQERYDDLEAGLGHDSEIWNSVRDALLNLTYLQGYNKLGAWSIELEKGGQNETTIHL